MKKASAFSISSLSETGLLRATSTVVPSVKRKLLTRLKAVSSDKSLKLHREKEGKGGRGDLLRHVCERPQCKKAEAARGGVIFLT